MPIEGRWYTTEEVANMLERQEQTISRAATRNGIGTRIPLVLHQFFLDLPPVNLLKNSAVSLGKLLQYHFL